MKIDFKSDIFLFMAIAVVGIGFMFFSLFNSGITAYSIGGHGPSHAKSYSNVNIVAKGDFTGERGGQIQIKFPSVGGAVQGTFSGTHHVTERGISAVIQYSGGISGVFAGGDNAEMRGTLSGTTKTTISGQAKTYSSPLKGDFSGMVSLSRGTITGSWAGDKLKGPFNLRFNRLQKPFPPTKRLSAPRAPTTPTTPTTRPKTPTTKPKAPAARPTATTNPFATVGYCRCRTGPATSGIEYTPYGGSDMEFKGFKTFSSCIDECPGRYSWRQR